MIATSTLHTILWAHVTQFSIGITLIALGIWLAGKRWPQIAFLLCMVALAKCLVPPIITSPAGLFTHSESVSFDPYLPSPLAHQVVRLKHQNLPTSESFSFNASYPIAELTSTTPGFWLSVVYYAWAIGSLVVLALSLRQLVRLRYMLNNMSPAPERILRLVREIAEEIDLKKEVSVLISAGNSGPACLGFLKPKLLIPQVLLDELEPRHLRPILAHELVHARRGDALWGYMQFFAQIVWWFHPLVWWLGRRANDLCERCCDLEVVTRTRCESADYAESLVRVLELRSDFQTVPLAHSVSSAQITKRRLERIMRTPRKGSIKMTLLNWSLCFCIAALLIPGMRWAAGENHVASVKFDKESFKPPQGNSFAAYFNEKDSRALIEAALEEGRWGDAVNLLEPIVEMNPADAQAVFYLGYAFHAAGELEQAIVYHEKATEFPSTKGAALYNWGCALALSNKQKEAIAKIKESISMGFVVESYLLEDKDLESLRDLNEFQELVKLAGSQRTLDFWRGSWSLIDGAGRVKGTSRITIEEKGHLVLETWEAADGRTGTGINYIHPSTRKWFQRKIDDSGNVFEYEGDVAKGVMKLEGTIWTKLGRPIRSRKSLQEQADGNLKETIEEFSEEEGRWKTFSITIYKRLASNIPKSETKIQIEELSRCFRLNEGSEFIAA